MQWLKWFAIPSGILIILFGLSGFIDVMIHPYFLANNWKISPTEFNLDEYYHEEEILFGRWALAFDKPDFDNITLIIFGGNGNHPSHFIPLIPMFMEKKIRVLIPYYPGYNDKVKQYPIPEFPFEINIEMWSQELLKQVVRNRPNDDIILAGFSLGGAVAINLAAAVQKFDSNTNLKKVILFNTFTSIPNVVKDTYPWYLSMFTPLIVSKWNSIDKINQIQQPILFIVGEKDDIVPSYHSEHLKDKTNCYIFKSFPNMTHMDLLEWTRETNFIEWMIRFIQDEKKLRLSGELHRDGKFGYKMEIPWVSVEMGKT